jgi:hypothetical protein
MRLRQCRRRRGRWLGGDGRRGRRRTGRRRPVRRSCTGRSARRAPFSDVDAVGDLLLGQTARGAVRRGGVQGVWRAVPACRPRRPARRRRVRRGRRGCPSSVRSFSWLDALLLGAFFQCRGLSPRGERPPSANQITNRAAFTDRHRAAMPGRLDGKSCVPQRHRSSL